MADAGSNRSVNLLPLGHTRYQGRDIVTRPEVAQRSRRSGALPAISSAVMLSALGILLGACAAQQPTTVPGTEAIMRLLTKPNIWIMRFTYSLSSAELDRWDRAPTTIEVHGEKLILKVNNPYLGRLELEALLQKAD